ncbi:MAG: hypothetical protein AAF655_27255, partial [Bacteroidota bacterium]
MKWRHTTFLILFTLILSGLQAQQAILDSLLRDFHQNDSLLPYEAFELIADSLESAESWADAEVFSDSIYKLGVSLNDTILAYAALYPLSRAVRTLEDSVKGDSIFKEA